MSKVRGFSVLSLAALSLLLLCASAEAATYVVGSPLGAEFSATVSVSGLFSTAANTVLGEAGASVTSPVSGRIVRWRTKGGFAGGGFRLRVLRPLGAGQYIGAGSSSFQTPVGTSLQSFSTDLPIQAGDLVGLDAEGKAATYSEGTAVGSTWTLFSPSIPEGSSAPPVATNAGEFGFDAEVVATPALIVIGPASGPLSGGTTVTIAGRELEGATAVKFGPNAASANFTVLSNDEITAVSPPGAGPGTVDVTVTTPGGESVPVAGDGFTYLAPPSPPVNPPQVTPLPPKVEPTCTVPSVIGKRVDKARKILERAGCKLGVVRKAKGFTAKAGGVVVKETPKPGKTAAAGTKVSVKLGRQGS